MNIISEYKYGKVIYNTNDYYMGSCISEYGEYCDDEIDLMSKFIKKNDVVLDIGANIGLMTIPFSKMVGENGTVISFEPQQEMFNILCGNVAINNLNNVSTHNIGLGNSTEPLFLPKIDYKKQNNFGGISLTNKGEIKIKQKRLDDFNFEKVNFLKIDVEGMELNVLNGSTNTIKNHRPFLYIENDRKDNSENLLTFLFSNNYNCFWHTGNLFNNDNVKKNKINVFDKNYMSLNVIAVPSEVFVDLKLKKINSPKDWFFN